MFRIVDRVAWIIVSRPEDVGLPDPSFRVRRPVLVPELHPTDGLRLAEVDSKPRVVGQRPGVPGGIPLIVVRALLESGAIYRVDWIAASVAGRSRGGDISFCRKKCDQITNTEKK